MKKESTLLIDCGNSFLKWCISEGGRLSAQQAEYHKEQSVLAIFQEVIEAQSSSCNGVVLVSVLGEVFAAGAKRIAKDAGLHFYQVESQSTLINIKNGYKDPEKIGTDRLVAVLGAFHRVNGLACIVIDSGTATTIDAVDATGQHLGGVIFPGLQTSLNSLSGNTELLPKIDFETFDGIENGFTKDTSHAISSGCLLSLAGGIDGICDKMETQMNVEANTNSGNIKRLLCGGNAALLLPHLTGSYDVFEDLVMQGLSIVQRHLNKE